uniref:Integrator complex subunit 5 n=1 Tax=Aceria tosichella TaxID=561515 RepID=A0A6G1S9G2_9ACAR
MESLDTETILVGADKVISTENLKVFLSYLCDKQPTNLDATVRSSTILFKYCIPAREAVLTFYGDLFKEYSTYYWTNNKTSVPPFSNSNNTTSGEPGPANVISELDKQLPIIRSTLKHLINKYGLTEIHDTSKDITHQQTSWTQRQQERYKNLIATWASDLLVYLNTKHAESSIKIATDQTRCDAKMFLAKQVEMWTENPVNKLLLDIIVETRYDSCQLFERLAASGQNFDWLLAYTLLEMSKQSNHGKKFTTCMDYIIDKSRDFDSLSYILAYILDKNPNAMTKFSRRHIPYLKLSLDLLSQLIVDKLCAAILDIDSIAQLIKLCCTSLERVDHARIRMATKHKLCLAMATSFFLLLETNGDRFPEILSYIHVNLTCMSLLKQSDIASHILCRALLERSLVYGHLFNAQLHPTSSIQDEFVKLSEENSEIRLGFRRLPNHHQGAKKIKPERDTVSDPGKPDRQSINSYLLIEAFKSSIRNIDAFADLFVEFHCPVMFEKNSWPADENLRVINERNLGILRKFEQVPPFWDLYELIGQAKCLKNCLVLVKALLAAHLALWASATAKSFPEKMKSTIRLIPPLAESDLVPRAFGLTVEVLPHLTPNEVFAVLSDIWNYLKDTLQLPAHEDELQDDVMARAKMYLTRLRIFMCHHMPGPTYVKIFKELYKPAPKIIPI